ncbi:LLM class F420-dependent oxidoreductase [Candidatus Poriferisocius sp.]|uniref:LLM class F420-dependent oxidoreductase n=1 Tax=Candidatus Poriferisocius sp. TaxID=3101276 RepID=UPI003B5A3D2F
MRLGIHLPQYGRAASPEAIAQIAMRAEEIGLADVWVSDHLVYPADQGYPASYLFDPLLTLGWAAAATERIGLGTSVMVVPQYHPLHLANSLASLDQLSGGRLTVGAGVGWSEAEFSALGQDFHTRGARMDEALEIMRLVWRESPASHQGNHYQFEDIKVLPQPAHPIPIWVGGSSHPGYDRAAAVGDGYQGLSKPPEEMGRIVSNIRAQLAESRPEAEFTFSYRTGWDPQGMDPAQIREERDRYAEAGVDHVVSAPWRTDAEAWVRSMEMLVDVVEPELVTP